MGLLIYLNGEFVEKTEAKVSVFDHGLLYGDGVFEGIRSYSRSVFRLDEHINRLYEGASAIRLDIGLTKDEMKGIIIDTLRKNNLDDAYIRVVVTRGVGDLGLDPRKCKKPTIFVITDKIALYPKEFYEKGLAIVTAKTRRNHPMTLDPRVKSLNYLNNILGKIDAIDGGTEEALMLTIDEHVAECTGDNIFIVKNAKLMTPPENIGALVGITQRTVIDIARKMGINFSYQNMRIDDVYDADECFLTGTAAEIIPVVRMDNKPIGAGKPGGITMRLLEEFHKFTKTNGVRY